MQSIARLFFITLVTLTLIGCSGRDIVDRPMGDVPGKAKDGPGGSTVSVVTQKTTKPMTLIARTESTDFNGVDAVINRSLPGLGKAAENAGLTINGPVILIYNGVAPSSSQFNLTVGMPLDTTGKRVTGKNILQTPSFTAASTHYIGPVEHIEVAYQHLIT